MGYLRNRLIQAAVTLYSIVTLGFVFIRIMPGGPLEYLLSQIRQKPEKFGIQGTPTQAEIERVIEEQLHYVPDGPLWEQYLTYMQGALQGDLGVSLIVAPGEPVMPLILEAAPWTIFLSSMSFVYGLVVSIIMGSLLAYYEGTKFDVSMTITMLVNGSIPFYVIAILLLYFFGYNLEWFPTGGHYNSRLEPGFSYPFIASIFNHAALPVMSMIFTGLLGGLGLRANAIRLLGSDYVRVARLRGLSTYTISTRYLARNAILPMYTGIVIGLGALIGGSVILEQIFAYPGMGLLMFNATISRDFPLLTASLIITTAIFVLGTLIADFTYALVDPRAEQSSMG